MYNVGNDIPLFMSEIISLQYSFDIKTDSFSYMKMSNYGWDVKLLDVQINSVYLLSTQSQSFHNVFTFSLIWFDL